MAVRRIPRKRGRIRATWSTWTLLSVHGAGFGRRLSARARKTDLFGHLFTPIYIGQTEDLNRRFLQHCRNPPPKLHAARRCFGASMQFWFHRLPLDRLKQVEAVLIASFGPTANDKKETIRATVGRPIPIGLHDR